MTTAPPDDDLDDDDDDDDDLDEGSSGPERSPAELRSLVLAAATCAAVVLASQLAGKAARDAIFLQEFQVKNLPLLLAVSSTLAIGTTLLYARRLAKGTPFRVVQLSNLLSIVFLIAEWSTLPAFPRVTATVVYMHQTLLGPILVSGFWSVVSECFDPRTARKVLGTVGTGATVGAVIGALIAERVAALANTRSLLLAIAVLQLIAAWRIQRIGKSAMPMKQAEQAKLGDVLRNLTRISLLRRLALVTVIVTIAASFLDYVFKAAASRQLLEPDELARFFALFHGVVGILTALVQWFFGRIALEKLGLARTLATLPGTVMAFGITALAAPGLSLFVLLRGSEYVVRNSLYREAYEVFYTPLLVHERRTTKTVIDVGVERLGDALGGIAVIALLAVVARPTTQLLIGAVCLSVLGVIVALQTHKSYVEALERSLLAHAGEPEQEEVPDKALRSTLEMLAQRETAGLSGRLPRQLQTIAITGMEGTGITGWRPSASGRWTGRAKKRGPAVAERSAVDPTLHRVTELVTGDPQRIKSSLLGELLSPAAIAYAIPLLARKDVVASVEKAIAKVAGPCLGQLVDAVRDPLVPLGARVELPKLIAAAVIEPQQTAASGRVRSELARAGLTACLADSEFEIRFQAAAALGELREHVPELQVDAAAVFEGVRRELAVDPEVWRALDAATTAAAEVASAGSTPKQLSRAAQHLATLLTLALPADPVRTAFQSLWSDDKTLRGVALEYLDNVLPDDIRERMWLVLALEAAVGEAPAEPAPTPKKKRPISEVLAELLRRPHQETRDASSDAMRETQYELPRSEPQKPPRS